MIGNWISTDYGVRHFDLGKFCRDMNEYSKELQAVKLLPDSYVIEAVENAIDECDEFLLLNGFARTIPQWQWLQQKVNKEQIDLIICDFVIPDDIALKHITFRSKEESRPDDDIQKANLRLGKFHATTEPVINAMKLAKNNSYYVIDRSNSKQDLYKSFQKV